MRDVKCRARRFASLIYIPKYEYTCIICGGPKSLVSNSVRDSPQAYEQLTISGSVQDLNSVLGVAAVLSGQENVTLVKDDLTRSFLGGTVIKVPDFRLSYTVIGFSEIVQILYCILTPTVVKVGDSVWQVPGATIDNPAGKIAILPATGKSEIDCQKAWGPQNLGSEKGTTWHRYIPERRSL